MRKQTLFMLLIIAVLANACKKQVSNQITDTESKEKISSNVKLWLDKQKVQGSDAYNQKIEQLKNAVDFNQLRSEQTGRRVLLLFL